MHTFFHGRRRKAGVATLVMAAAFTSGWLRSLIYLDVLQFPSGKRTMEHCVSVDHSIVWGRLRPNNPASVIGFPVCSSGPYCSLDSFLDHANLRCAWRGYGFGGGELNVAAPDHLRHTIWFFPYWLMVLPLTLLSAYLILWKPRKQV